MASSVIHMCVANEVNKYLKKDNSKILIGSIAPDISKQIGMTKEKSHFLDSINDSVPNIDKFLNKYKNYLNNDFVMGYFIHLYTDYLWFKFFMPNFIKKDFVYDLNGNKVYLNEEEKLNYIYNDYTNLNIRLLDEYNLDLGIFYKDIPNIENIINEIPMDKLNIIIQQAGLIIKNTKESKSFIFDIEEINKFIDFSVSDILAQIEKIIQFKERR